MVGPKHQPLQTENWKHVLNLTICVQGRGPGASGWEASPSHQTEINDHFPSDLDPVSSHRFTFFLSCKLQTNRPQSGVKPRTFSMHQFYPSVQLEQIKAPLLSSCFQSLLIRLKEKKLLTDRSYLLSDLLCAFQVFKIINPESKELFKEQRRVDGSDFGKRLGEKNQ